MCFDYRKSLAHVGFGVCTWVLYFRSHILKSGLITFSPPIQNVKHWYFGYQWIKRSGTKCNKIYSKNVSELPLKSWGKSCSVEYENVKDFEFIEKFLKKSYSTRRVKNKISLICPNKCTEAYINSWKKARVVLQSKHKP